MSQRVQGFRLAIYVFKDAEIVDFACGAHLFVRLLGSCIASWEAASLDMST
jgi:hypothetical protein